MSNQQSNQQSNQPSNQPVSHQTIDGAAAGLTRRNALFAGAGVIAGSAAAVVGTRLNSRGEPNSPEADAATSTKLDVPVMIQVANASSGAFDLYVGSEVFRLVDSHFAAQVATAARKAKH